MVSGDADKHRETEGRFSVSFYLQDGPEKRCAGKIHANFVFVQDIPFALLRAPDACWIVGRTCIHTMPGSAAGSQRAPSARNILNSQSSAIDLPGASFPVRFY